MSKNIAVAYSLARKKKDKSVKQHEELQAKRGESYGAEATGVHSPSYSSGKDRGQSFAGDAVRYPSYGKDRMEMAKQEHKSNLSELKSMKGPESGKSGFARGGMAGDCPHCGKAMSEGGVAEREGDEIVAGFEDNKFDVLPELDGLSDKADYTGKNSGDELGDPKDLVSRAMRKRKK